jgi:hypothetical protein
MKKVAIAGVFLAFVLLPSLVFAEEGGAFPHSGFFLSAHYSSVGGPIFRAASGNEEVAISGSSGKPGFMIGYEYNWEKFGFAARVSYFQASYPNFQAPEMPGSMSPYMTYVKYDSPRLTFLFLDLIVQWFPVKNGLLGIYALLGMGVGSENYTLSGSNFSDWNGPKSLSEFDYSYGFGVRFSPVRFVSLFGEMRFVPGDTSTDLKFLYSDSKYDYFQVGASSTPHTSSIFLAGLAVNF